MTPDWIQKLPANLHTPLQSLLAAHQSQQLPQVILFSGLAGMGQELAAVALARYLACETHSTSPAVDDLFGDAPAPKPAPCGQCFACKMTNPREDYDGSNPWTWILPLRGQSGQGRKDREDRAAKLADLGKELALDPWHEAWEGQGAHNVDSARDLLESFRSSADKHRIVLICAAEKMNEHAANALLKTLEEAPPNTWFLLTTSARGQILPTILSRCLKVPLSPLDFPSFQNLLRAEEPEFAAEETATLLFALTEGSWGQARRWLKRDLRGLRRAVFSYLETLGYNRLRPIALWMTQAQIGDKDRERTEHFLQLLYLIVGDLVAVRAGVLPRNRDAVEKLQHLGERVPTGKEQDVLAMITQALDRHRRYMAPAVNLHTLSTNWLQLLEQTTPKSP